MPENTPSGRVLLLDGHLPDAGERFARTGRLVAQLTQNMNFVLDMGARDFVAAHAESRMAADPLHATACRRQGQSGRFPERFEDRPLTA